jgi:hypothetical protein
MAITRRTIVDDDGSGLTGTIADAAWMEQLYDDIDAYAALLGPSEDIPFFNIAGPTAIRTFTFPDADATVFTSQGIANTALKIRDTDASHFLSIVPGSNLTADRVFTLVTGDAARTLTLSGNPTLGDWFDQAVKVASSPTFANLTLASAGVLAWSTDLKLNREAAGVLSQRDGASDQRFRIGTAAAYLDFLKVNGGVAQITVRDAQQLQLGTNNSVQWAITATGHLVAAVDNTYDFGASGTTRPRTGYFGTRVVSPEFQTTTALVALGGGAAPTVGTIGGSGPATAAQNTWLRMVDSTGAAFFVPVWK